MSGRPKWDNPKIELFHGTSEEAAAAIRRDGINPLLGRRNSDFGRGFYTTTWLDQARHWAVAVARRQLVAKRTALVKLTLDRLILRSFKSIAFVRGTKEAGDFWSFVEHCRNRAEEGLVTGEYYDVVYGPVAMRWGRMSMTFSQVWTRSVFTELPPERSCAIRPFALSR